MHDLARRIANASSEQRALLMARLQKTGAASVSRVQPRIARDEAPLSHAQERLWFLSQLEPDAASYHISAALRLSGRLDHAALERALNELMRRHAVLRTCFVAVDGRPLQKIHPSPDLTIARLDLSDLPEKQQDEEIRRRIAADARQPFDLAHGPLLRVSLLALTPPSTTKHSAHVLLFTVHHIVFDGWSVGILLDEFTALYAAFHAGRPSPLAELPLQYADYAAWQRTGLQGEVFAKQMHYWRRQLAGAPPLLELPTDRPRPATRSRRGAAFRFTLADELSASLYALSRREKATVFMTLAAAFKTLLLRYSGQTDISVGTPVANRARSELENLIGFFVNTLVLRTDLAGNPPFSELLARERRVCLEAQAHQDLPFEKLVEALQPERRLNHSPLFQVMFVFTQDDRQAPVLPELRAERLDVDTHAAPFDLTLLVTAQQRALSAEFEYDLDLFEPDRIARMADHFQTLLRGIAVQQQTPIGDLPLLTDAERRVLMECAGSARRDGAMAVAALPLKAQAVTPELRLLENHSGDALRLPPHSIGAKTAVFRLHTAFETWAARTPDAIALVQGGRRYSYRELNAQANRLARELQRRGAGPDVPVALCLERSPELALGILAVLKAGAAYVPIDPGYPQARIAATLADCGAPLWITRQRRLAAPPDSGARVLCLERDAPAIARHSPENLAGCGHDLNAAYLIYTSGSTGAPKGVVVSHRNAVHSTLARLDYYEQPVAGFLVPSSFAFDSSVAGIFWSWSQGGTLCLPGADEHQDPALLAGLIERERLTHVLCLPSLYALLLERAGHGRLDGLRTVILAGEACPPALVAEHYRRLPAVPLYNEYGPTEASVWCSVHRCTPADAATAVPIGRPIAATQLYLLDARLHPVPIGVPGELYVGGAGITRGYLNQPRATAERYLPDPFGKGAGARLYRTGDRARYRADGKLEFLGRVDQQIKLSGFRIEPGEIESRLRSHPWVREAAVIVREDAPGVRRLVAYVVGEQEPSATMEDLSFPRSAWECSLGRSASRNTLVSSVANHPAQCSATLREFLKAALPEHMIPAAFVVLDKLPLTPNGKLDRKALPAPLPNSADSARHVAPRDAVEQKLAQIWGEVLGIERVSVADSFFEIGGYSLLAMRLAAGIESAFQRPFPVRSVFLHPTIAAQAQCLLGQEANGADVAMSAAALEAAAVLAPDIRIATLSPGSAGVSPAPWGRGHPGRRA
ncbi:MAG: amino acid adenylation domain-containing protein, partial [Methylococcaceae bacterium]